MQVSVETTGKIGRRMTITLPAEDLESAVAARLKNVAKGVKMPGFRPGKVPMKMVEAKYGQQVVQEVTGELIESSFIEAVGKEGLRPAGGPRIEPKALERGKAIEYVAEFEVYPEIPKPNLDGVVVKKPICELSESDVDQTLETMRKQQRTWELVERASKEGDQVVIDFKGKIDGEYFKGGEGHDYPLELGSGAMIPGFEEGVDGIKAGEERVIEVTFPEQYQAAHLAGKTAQFEITAKAVNEARLPDLDEDFALKLGVEGGLEKLRQDVRDNLEREKAVRLRNLTRSKILDALLKANEFDVPAGLVQQEIQHMKQSDQKSRQAQGLSMPEVDNKLYEDAARKRVALGLIMAEIVSSRNLRPDDDTVKARVEEFASGYEHPEDVVRWYYEQPNRLKEIQSVVVEEKVVEELLKEATVEDNPVTFQELLGNSAGNQ